MTDPFALVAIDMGYGHLRAAWPLAVALGTPVLAFDQPPLATEDDRRRWARSRRAYEGLSRASQGMLGATLFRPLLDQLTNIPAPYPRRDLSGVTLGAAALERMARAGLGRQLVEHLAAGDRTLVTTFYAPAVVAAYHGHPRIVCVVTDTDVNRVWVPASAAATRRIQYCVPTERTRARLRAYGVPSDNIEVTGFPLPAALLGGAGFAALRRQVAQRIVRLDRRGTFRREAHEELGLLLGPLPEPEMDAGPPRIAYAVGGAGAQLGNARAFLPTLRRPLEEGRLRLALVAGMRDDVAEALLACLAHHGMAPLLGGAVEVVRGDDFADYQRRFEALLLETDILWTKPSELTFYGALGMALLFARPVGVHERANRKWARQRGAALKQERPGFAWDWIREWLDDGTFASAAWSGFARLPKRGTMRIAEVARRVAGLPESVAELPERVAGRAEGVVGQTEGVVGQTEGEAGLAGTGRFG